MSHLRPELVDSDPKTFAPKDGTAYYMILSAVQRQDGLVHGKLHAYGAHCAIGSFFDVNKQLALPHALIDEVAAVNDSVPHLTTRRRKLHVMRWLKWKLASLGMTGFTRAAKPTTQATKKRAA